METKTVTVDGLKIAYVEEGHGVPVLYVHGNTGSKRWFSRVMDVAGYRTIAPDMPNFADSEASGTYDMEEYARVMRSFLKELEIDEYVLVGHSLGGAVAMAMAVQDPNPIKRLILVDSSPVEGLVTPKEHYPAIEAYKTNRDLLKTGLAAVTPTLTDGEFLDQLVDDASRMDPGAFTGHPDALATADYRERAKGVSVPTTVIVGDKDILIKDIDGQHAADAFGGTLIVLDGVGHSPMVENPTLFKETLLRVLEEG